MAGELVVSGAGASAWNGNYDYQGQYDGKPYYELPPGGYFIGYDSDNEEWVFSASDDFYGTVSPAYWVAHDGEDYPWEATSWNVGAGDAPAPTVSQGGGPTPAAVFAAHYAMMRNAS